MLRADEQSLGGDRRPIGGIVPHAGWICSGAIAGQTIATLAREGPADVVIVFGAIHTPLEIDKAVFDVHADWHVPGGDMPIATDLQAKVTESSGALFGVDERFHRREHAVEVELPLIAQAWPAARVLPIEVPVNDDAVAMGERVAKAVEQAGLKGIYLASSDLTHYGPAYQMTVAGVGLDGLAWAKENDRRLLEIVTAFAPERVVAEVKQRYNACGGGAIAAMLGACRASGARQARVLRHASSYETLADVAPQSPDNAVGYAGVIVG